MLKLRRVARLEVGAAGLASTLAAMPALAALTFEMPFVGGDFPLRDWILAGSLALLAVAIALRMLRSREGTEPLSDGPDLRWWRNP
jgi:hypothetical protein